MSYVYFFQRTFFIKYIVIRSNNQAAATYIPSLNSAVVVIIAKITIKQMKITILTIGNPGML